MKRARINLSLENDLLEWLETEARSSRISVSAYVRQLVDAAQKAEKRDTLRETCHPLARAPAARTETPQAGAATKPPRYTITRKP